MIECPHSLYFFRCDIEKFDDMSKAVNSLKDWHIVPLGRPVIVPPQQKLQVIDIPGANGVLDLSNSLTKYPVFNNRQGTLQFAILHEETDTPTAYTQMMRFLQGTDVKMILEDDPLYYYEGRVYVDSIDAKSDGTHSEVTLGYDLFPYRKSIYTADDEDWLWDPFNFETDVITSGVFSGITINSPNDFVEYDFSGLIDMMPVNPVFTCSAQMTAQLYNTDLGINWEQFTLPSGSKSFYDLIFCEFTPESQVKMRFKGTGTISISFRSGRL